MKNGRENRLNKPLWAEFTPLSAGVKQKQKPAQAVIPRSLLSGESPLLIAIRLHCSCRIDIIHFFIRPAELMGISLIVVFLIGASYA